MFETVLGTKTDFLTYSICSCHKYKLQPIKHKTATSICLLEWRTATQRHTSGHTSHTLLFDLRQIIDNERASHTPASERTRRIPVWLQPLSSRWARAWPSPWDSIKCAPPKPARQTAPTVYSNLQFYTPSWTECRTKAMRRDTRPTTNDRDRAPWPSLHPARSRLPQSICCRSN